MTTEFDTASLFEACAGWGNSVIMDRVAGDAVLESTRQILLRLSKNPPKNLAADLVALFRQVLLRRPVHRTGNERVRVPIATGWPDAEQWRSAGFEVIVNTESLSIRAKLPRLDFLAAQADLFDAAFTDQLVRRYHGVAADPIFHRLLGLPHYTGLGQREAVRALVQLPAGVAMIADLPTGSGKSVLAQIPPLLMGPGFLTMAIVPTIALAIDQADRMTTLLQAEDPNRTLPSLSYHSGLDEAQRKDVWKAIQDGRQRILFMSPESATSSLRAVLEGAAREGRLSHIVVDEAHLVIGWGNGFRPAFQLLPALVRGLQRLSPSQPIRLVLASATLTASTITALQQLFAAELPMHLVAGVYLRSEPRYAFAYCRSFQEKRDRVLQAIAGAPRPLILYVTRPDEADSWAQCLRGQGYERLAVFTGKTLASERERLLTQWKRNEIDIIVATSAFGSSIGNKSSTS